MFTHKGWAAQLDLRVTGPGVTPFGPANQQRLINVFADASRNISQSAFRIILVADAYTFRRRLQVCARIIPGIATRMALGAAVADATWHLKQLLLLHARPRAPSSMHALSHHALHCYGG